MPLDENDLHLRGTLPLDPTEDAEPYAPQGGKDSILRWRPFPLHCLPTLSQSFVRQMADSLGCDPTYIVMPHVAALAGCIGNRRGIQLKPDWVEPAVMWTAVIARSGTMKSPAQSAALRPLMDAETAALEDFNGAYAEYERRREKWQSSEKKSRGLAPEPPQPPDRLVISDITIEAVGERLLHNPGGLLLARDELAAWLLGFDRYRSGKGGDAQSWLEMHGARPLIVDRKSGQPFAIRRAAVSVTGGIQPGTLSKLLGREHFVNGMAARIVMAQPPSRPKVWSDTSVDGETCSAISELYTILRALSLGCSEDGRLDPIDIPLSPEATNIWIAFYNEHAQHQAQARSDKVAASLAKMEAYAARFALIHYVVEHAAELDGRGGCVDEASIRAGIEFARWASHEQQRIYQSLDEDQQAKELRSLVELIAARNGAAITPRELMHAKRSLRDSAETARAKLDELERLGLGYWRDRDPGSRGGQPTREFVLHEEKSE